jgi:hypothetical protein
MSKKTFTVKYVDTGRCVTRYDDFNTLYSVCFYNGIRRTRRVFAAGESDVVRWLGGDGVLAKQPQTQYVRVFEHADDDDDVGVRVQVYIDPGVASSRTPSSTQYDGN